MSRTPLTTVAVFHGDGNITLYHPGSDGVIVDESVMGYNGPVDISLEFQSFGTSNLLHTVPLRNTLEVLGLPDPYSPASLEAAYEAAEVPADDAPIRKGDVMIYPIPNGHSVREAGVDDGMWRPDTRILSRAPREPWQDLADVLGADNGELIGEHRTITEVAKSLHERGVRVVGGGES